MANLNTPNTTPEENNQEPRKFPWDFLGRYKDGIVIGRTREVDGKKIYEVSEDIRHGTKEENKRRIEISEQEHAQIKQEYQEEDKRLKEKEVLDKKLRKIGATHETGSGDSYINLLFDVLDEHQIVTLEEISEHSRQQILEEDKIDYSYPFDNPLIGARSYTKDGAIIYEIQEPLSDDYYLVTEERYEQFITQRKDIRNKEREKTQKQVEKYTKLNKLGYYQNPHRNSEEYEEHLINTLDENNISHIKEIPLNTDQNREAIETGERETTDQQNIALQLFQGLTQLKHTPDIYEQEIIAHLERCEAIIEHRYIDTYGENDFLKISQLFSTGYIKNLELFYRFEKLKKQNIINHYRKLYTYGSVRIELGRNKYGSKIDIEKYNTEESTSITQDDFSTMMYLIYTNGDTIADLGIDFESVLQKIKNGYKNRWKDYFIGKEQFMPNSKHGFSEFNFKRLGIDIETRELRAKEAEEEFVIEFGIMVENILNEKIENEGNTKSIGGIILKIKENIEKNPENRVLQKNIADLLYQKIHILIEKIHNKEKIEKTDWRNKRDLSYKNHITKLCNSIEMLHKVLKSLDPLLAEQTGWQQNKDTYINEYKEYFRNKFIERRKQDFAKMDLTDTDAVKQKIVQDVKARFYKRATTRGKRRADSLNFNGFISKDESSSRGNRGVIGSLVGSFFDTGHALLLKTMYPDEKERTEIRRAYSQQIIEELINEIQEHLTNESTFKWEEYIVVRPMLHVYKKYGGKKNILTQKDKINDTIYATRKKDFETLGYQRVKETEEASHDEKNTISDKEKYELVHYLRWFMRSYISYFAEEKGLNLSLTQPTDKEKGINIKEKNQKRSNITTESCIDDLSFFGTDIDELEATIDPDIFNMMLDIYNQVEAPTENIMDQLLHNRFTRNAQAGGKLQRIIEDYLKRSFGSINLDESQIESIFIYLHNNLVQIILQDLIGPDQDIKILERDQKRINKYILEYIEHLKKSYQNFKALQ